MDHTASRSSASQEPNDPDIIRSLVVLRERYEEDRLDLQEKMDALLRQIDAVELLIGSETAQGDTNMTTDRIQPDGGVVNTTSNIRQSDDSPDEVGPVSGTATVQDIAHCKTQREAGRVIAEVNGGFIDLKSAAPVIKAAGLSGGMLNTIVSSLHHFMSHSADWRYTGPSAFELLTYREKAPKAGSETDSGDEDLSEEGISEASPTTLREYEETPV